MFIMPTVILAIENEDDRAYMQELFAQYHRLMYHEIVKILRNCWDAEDVMQDAVEKLIDKLALLRGLSEKKRINYIITVSKNKAISHLRKVGREKTYYVADWNETETAIGGGEDPEERILRQEEIEALAAVWEELDLRDQYVLAGRYILEDSYEEMAKELGVQPASVRTFVTRAKRNAQKRMREKET